MFIISCSKSYVGTYISEADSKSYMELKSDDTFLISDGKTGMMGKFEIKNEIIIFTLDMGIISQGKIQKNFIVDPDGVTWTKK